MTQTTDNLKAAFAGESQASRKYLAFARKADQEGHPQIARMFRAAAQAETVHAAAHLRALEGLLGCDISLRGNQLTLDGAVGEVERNPASLTGQYLSGARSIPVPPARRAPNGKSLVITGAREHNLKNLDVSIPLGLFVCVTGVSGSGKSTLINEILHARLARDLNRAYTKPGAHDSILGTEYLDKVIGIDQSPIGRTPASLLCQRWTLPVALPSQ